MMADKPNAYDEEISPEEQAALDAHLQSGGLPPPDENEGDGALEAAAVDAGQTPAPPAAPASPAPPAPPAPAAAPAGTEPAPPVAPVVDPALASWLEQHKDKTPEQLAELAFNANKRAAKEGFKARTSTDQLRDVSNRAATTLATRRTAAEAEKAAFRDKLAADPDAAAIELNDARIDAEIAAAEAAVEDARIEEAIGFAETYIPDFQTTAPQVFSFGEEMGYSKDEVRGIKDGRDLVVLNLARVAGNLMKAGVIDVRGNFLQAPEPIAATDPRLTGPAPVATLNAPARTGAGANSVETRLASIANMSDADFDKLTDADLENLQREAMG